MPYKARVSVLGLLPILGLMCGAQTTQSQTTYDQTGRWTSPYDTGAAWSHRQIHMALLRGDSNAHSYLMSWHGSGDTLNGSVLRWNPPLSNDDYGSYPNSTIALEPADQPGPAGVQIFCSGHGTMSDGSGNLFVVGGTDAIAGNGSSVNGHAEMRVFDRAAKEWSDDPDHLEPMTSRRYYPTVTTLPSGELLVANGWEYFHMLSFGGRTDPADSSTARSDLERLQGLDDSEWDSPAPSGTPWPEARWNHTAAIRHDPSKLDDTRGIVFGGTDDEGSVLDDTWLLKRSQSYDHNGEYYVWIPAVPTGSRPSRTHHGAIVASNLEMFIYGGLDGDLVAQEDVQRLFLTGSDTYAWATVQTSTSPSEDLPGKRYNHAMVYEKEGNRILVFGGRGESGLADDNVYALELSQSPALWKKLDYGANSQGPPAAREGHTLLMDNLKHWRTTTEVQAQGPKWDRVVLYGGKSASGLEDDVWMLWVNPNDPDEVEWQSVSPATPNGEPAARYEHAADWVLDAAGRILVVGGDAGAQGESDADVWALDLFWPVPGQGTFTPQWTQQSSASGLGPALAGHTTIKDFVAIDARFPEVYNPAAGDWEVLTSAPRRSTFYPDMSVLPSGNVFMAGPEAVGGILDMDASPPVWTNAAPNAGFYGHAAVMYRPGEVMRCRGTSTVIKFDESDHTAGWQSFSGFQARLDHNLTILPDGTVLATGGLVPGDTAHVRGPQIWTPPPPGSGSEVTGSWTTYGDLAIEPAFRRHHSVATLLADGRVVTGSEGHHLQLVTIYAPPYLFDGDDPAVRPVIDGVPQTAAYDDTVTVCTPDAADIESACLIRPGATTHENNMDQRYVELSILGSGSGEIYVATPKNANYAPPGDYLLFLLNDAGTPSIASWVTVADGPGPDACDEIAPGTTTDLEPEVVSNNTIYMTWSASADDSYQAASGRGELLEFRYSQQAIATDQAWYSASLALQQQAPSVAGQGASFSEDVTGLQSCTWYHFAVRMEDDNENQSNLPSEVKVKTLCSGGGGGGPSGATSEVVNATTGELTSMARDGARRGGLSTQSGGAGTAAALTVETEPLGDGTWRFVLRSLASLEDADASKVLRQQKDASGAWRTESSLQPNGGDSRLGICATGRSGRKSFPGAWELMEVASTLTTPAGDLVLVSAGHSSQGSLEEQVWEGTSSVSLSPGETLTLVYEPSDLETEASGSWFALLQKAEDWTAPSRDLVRGESLDLPATFALYQNQPNPFRHTTRIRFDLSKPASVRLAIYDIAGRKVRTLTSSGWPAGRHSLEWDHRSDAGVQLGGGAYIYRLATDEYRSEKKMILLAR